MIFYVPGPIDDEITSGSRVRPRAMLAAFRALGFDVEEVTGHIDARLSAMRRVRKKISSGVKFAFLYVETSTLPLHLTEPRLALLHRHPLADARFLAFCRRQGVPVGIYYRDIHWRFSHYRALTRRWRRLFRLPFYLLEVWLYARLAHVLYVPHSDMAANLPFRFRSVAALPPGANSATAASGILGKSEPDNSTGLHILYVGGLGPLYRMQALLDAVDQVEGVRLTLCCRQADWRRFGGEYGGLDGDRIRVIHQSGANLEPYYASANLLSGFLEPNDYLAFAMPVKLFEYLAHRKPILATADTAMGRFVKDHDIGWCVPYDRAELIALLSRLRESRADFAEKAANATRLLPKHTWIARAQKVAADLTAPNPG